MAETIPQRRSGARSTGNPSPWARGKSSGVVFFGYFLLDKQKIKAAGGGLNSRRLARRANARDGVSKVTRVRCAQRISINSARPRQVSLVSVRLTARIDF